MEKKVLLTEEAAQKLRAELEELIALRQEYADDIRTAKDFGDLSENSEYTAAKEAQTITQAKIEEKKALLENYEVYKEEKGSKNKVTIGSRVKFEYVESGEIEEIEIVTIVDTDPLAGKISNESPLGFALMGQKKNSVVAIQTPTGAQDVKILSISK